MDVARYFLFLLFPSLFFLPLQTQSNDSFTSILISQNGLDFVKNLLVNKAITSIIPLQVPRIEKSMRIPFLGGIDVVVSNLTIYEVDVASSYVKLGDTGVVIVASGTSCNLSMNWHYKYSTWLPPIEISDQGIASVQVKTDTFNESLIHLYMFLVQIKAKTHAKSLFLLPVSDNVFVFESVVLFPWYFDPYMRLKIQFSLTFT